MEKFPKMPNSTEKQKQRFVGSFLSRGDMGCGHNERRVIGMTRPMAISKKLMTDT